MNLSHSRLDVESADVLPALLEEGNQKVDGQNDVSTELLVLHANVSDGDTEAENLLKLELNGGLELNELGLELGLATRSERGREENGTTNLDVLLVGQGGGEHTHLVELGTQQTRDLTDEGLRSQETIILVGCEWRTRANGEEKFQKQAQEPIEYCNQGRNN